MRGDAQREGRAFHREHLVRCLCAAVLAASAGDLANTHLYSVACTWHEVGVGEVPWNR